MRSRLAALIVVALTCSGAGVAAAHSDTGAFRLVSLQPTEVEHEVELVVDLAYEDGHAVYRGSVELAGRSDTGVSLLPVALDATAIDGRYVTRVELPPPGTWTLQIASELPTAELEVDVDTAAPGYVDEALAPLPTGSGHGVPWRWILVGIAAVSVTALVISSRTSRPGDERSGEARRRARADP